ncbi:hypothetical protein EDD69_106120 [Thermolongibacillus altinsuensis]|uniref:Uncharacterized protein n=1 Tax=Thermolongibacillus altinsuensis TaxID=575256 RepID=A0A4V2QAA6_9BACL|nr:hypothetical protein EDD69_106120 [Thermolongibacillus altinsuensis]
MSKKILYLFFVIVGLIAVVLTNFKHSVYTFM